MRINAYFDINTDWLVIDYRQIFMSLLKKIIETYEPNLLNYYYGDTTNKKITNKPFTFAIRFPNFKKFEKNKIECGNKIIFTFSSNNCTLLTAFYNSLNKIKKFEIGKTNPIHFNLTQIQLIPKKNIYGNKIKFKTISPILLNDKGKKLDYITPKEINFEKAFKFNIAEQAKQFNIFCTEGMINYQIDIEKIKPLPLTHYNQTMTSWMGEFILEAPNSVLQLIYDTGIGVRRSQGFGMLEIIKTY